MNLRKFRKIIGIVSLACLAVSCDKNFEDLNVDPTNAVSAFEDHLFTSGQLKPFVDRYTEYYAGHFNWKMRWFQMVTDGGNNAGMMDLNTAWVGSFWNLYYSSGMPDLIQAEKQMLALPESERAARTNKLAQIRIAKAYLTHRCTDAFGDIPYSQAFKARDVNNQVITPAYDNQEAIYEAMLTDLKEAKSAMIQDAGQINFGNADVWFKGDITKWKRFANSLRLRLAMRLSKVNPTKAKALVQEILSDPDGVMQSNADALKFNLGNRQASSQPAFQEIGQQRFAAATLLDFMFENNDPRLRVFFVPNEYSEKLCAQLGVPYNSRRFVGGPSTPDNVTNNSMIRTRNAEQGVYDTLSRLNPRLFHPQWNKGTASMIEVQFSYAEVCFLKAEAAVYGWYTGQSAEELYNEGVSKSIEQWFEIAQAVRLEDALHLSANGNPTKADGDPFQSIANLQASEVQAMLQAPGVKFDPDRALEQIMLQSWINFFKDAHQTWANWRRTGYPNNATTVQFEPFVAGGQQLEIPRRYPYPSQEDALNGNSLKEAAGRLSGGDTPYSRVWWDSK